MPLRPQPIMSDEARLISRGREYRQPFVVGAKTHTNANGG